MVDILIPAKYDLKITTYEKVGPDEYSETLTHTFSGNTPDEALAVLNAHRTTDTFFNASFSGVFHYKGKVIELKNSEAELIRRSE